MSRGYDRSLVTFSPDGHLFQVRTLLQSAPSQLVSCCPSYPTPFLSTHSLIHTPPLSSRFRQVDYALEAVRKGTCAVGVRGKDVVVLGVEKKSVMQLQDPRTVRKTAMIDDHICLGFAGLTADARILVDRARIECQSHRLTVEDPVTVEYITRHVAGIQQVRHKGTLGVACLCLCDVAMLTPPLLAIPIRSSQKYTQSGGMRPFGISCLIIGFDHDDPTPRLYLTEPSGIFSAWRANAIGRSSKTVREFLEKNWVADLDKDDCVKLAVKSLLEVVQTGAKNIDLAVMTGHGQVRVSLSKQKPAMLQEIEAVVAEIEKEKEAEQEKKKNRLAATAASREAMTAGPSVTQSLGEV
ncbi:BQ2448_5996 [Microbotryum intermedium]|uniref:BQ2448_5996 protein n=1 Tax=Microbotryum intermedium TaxID=269621 RepID=A0A238EZQ5_9BASI|nr:BQ2448_5996 [Microbotryum intermedium]